MSSRMGCVSHRGFRAVRAIGLLMLYAAWMRPVAADEQSKPLMSSPQVVRDLYYGDALFYFYQGDYFQSLIRLDAARTLGRLPNHEAESQLLMGALYLSLGQHLEAGRIFKFLLDQNVSVDVRNRTWFYLGKLWYQRDYFVEAETAFNSIQGELAPEFESERRMLMAQVLMGQNRFDEAIRSLEPLQTKDEWGAYARFNLGVALIRQQRDADGVRLLDEVGRLEVESAELVALRDKANLALGFTLLKTNKPVEAKAALQRVRLQGPQTNKALLGLGWADAADKRYGKALVSWLELKQRNVLDAAVQEAYLAIPYAYAQLAAETDAANYYAQAIETFRTERIHLDESIQGIRGGGLLNTLLADDSKTQIGWYWRLKEVPDAPETRYLYQLLASNVFQEALKNYRDLRLMQRNLNSWQLSVAAFKDMIDTRKLAYGQRSELLEKALDGVSVDALEAQVLDLAARVATVERDNDVAALGTPREQALWRQVTALEKALTDSTPNDALAEEMREKVRLMKGVLYWDFNANYKARLWREKKELRELETASRESRRRTTLIARAREDYPKRTAEFGEKVAALESRLTQLVMHCQRLGEAQNQYLADLAVRELESQQQRLAAYTLQAQYALASIYDKAADAAPSAGKEGAP